MCQSKAQGGRRCHGRNGAAATATLHSSPAATAARTAPADAGTAVPTRERADQLAAQLPADRTGWDGKPLSEVDRRFYALRESGYAGPINQDGYPETTGPAVDALRHMARLRGETVTW